MSVSIKVAIRCRPYTIDDKLGVKLRQLSEEEGEVELINSDYSTSRFPFTYSWWSAYGYKRHLTGDNMQDADDMILVDQIEAYRQCGLKIKADLLGGNAVVLFAVSFPHDCFRKRLLVAQNSIHNYSLWL